MSFRRLRSADTMPAAPAGLYPTWHLAEWLARVHVPPANAAQAAGPSVMTLAHSVGGDPLQQSEPLTVGVAGKGLPRAVDSPPTPEDTRIPRTVGLDLDSLRRLSGQRPEPAGAVARARCAISPVPWVHRMPQLPLGLLEQRPSMKKTPWGRWHDGKEKTAPAHHRGPPSPLPFGDA